MLIHSNTSAQVGSGPVRTQWQYGEFTTQLGTQLKNVSKEVYLRTDATDDAADEIDDASLDRSFHPSSKPDAVVYPRTTEEVVQILRLCNQYRIPLTTRGAGTGLEGAAIPYTGGVVLSTARMKDMSVRKEDMVAVVQPGVLKMELNKFLEPHGLLFGPDPSSNPSIGGMASTGGSGLSTVKYGTTKENVVALKVVTPSGEVVTTRQSVRKASTGYELTQLYMGSEGTLGVIVELTVKCHPILKHRVGALLSFKDLKSASSCVVSMVRSSLGSLLRCELLNASMVHATNKMYKTDLDPLPTLFLEFQSDDKTQAEADARRAQEIAGRFNCVKRIYADEGAELDELWSARRGCYPAAIKFRGSHDKVYCTDVCVPVSKLAQCVSETESDFESNGFPSLICAHIADGNFHCNIPYLPEEKDAVKRIETRMIERAIGYGGAVSGEHGIGIGKREHIVKEHGVNHINIQRDIKRALDPNNIMNPEKIFTTHPPTQSRL
eukprot:GFYU01004202.1.p1 GENE.GFYU01004202.1~~GFYU01004202.1.p1  ORF type:complete len:504 (-),score=122.31 GFYU01004202.1:1655-3136(-)